MTREEAIRELKADYCGNRIICELYPDQCNREDCEIWLAIKALETQPDGDAISRQAAIDAAISADMENHSGILSEKRARVIDRHISAVPSAQPEITPDGTLNVSIDADIASVGRILLSQTGTQRGGLYYKDEQPEIIRCKDCKHRLSSLYCEAWNNSPGFPCIGDEMFCSFAERRTDE